MINPLLAHRHRNRPLALSKLLPKCNELLAFSIAPLTPPGLYKDHSKGNVERSRYIWNMCCGIIWYYVP